MNTAPEAEIFRNGIVLSESPSKRFALVEVDGITYSASKDPEKEVKRGNIVVVSVSNRKDPRIV